MASYETVNYWVSNQVATITLNRPKQLNSFNTQMRMDLLAAVTEANSDSSVRIVIISGEGRAFSAGADIADGFDQYATIEEQIVGEYKPFLMAIDKSPKLFISAINGACAGVGSALALVCDLAVMADDAYIYQAFAAIGLIPDGGASYHLINALGYKKALEAIVTAGKLKSDECLAYGLVNKVVAAEELMSVAQAWAEQLAKGAPLSQKFAKEVLKRAQQGDLQHAIDIEAKIQNVCISSQDHKNAAIAFLNKEPILFEGK